MKISIQPPIETYELTEKEVQYLKQIGNIIGGEYCSWKSFPSNDDGLFGLLKMGLVENFMDDHYIAVRLTKMGKLVFEGLTFKSTLVK